MQEHARAVSLYDDVVVLHPTAKDSALSQSRRLVGDADEALTFGLPTYRLQRRPARLPGLSSVGYVRGVIAAVHELMAGGFRPDVIHAHVYEAGVPAVLIGAQEQIPVVITEHASAFLRRDLAPWQVLKARFACERARRVLPVSWALQRSIEAYWIRARFTVVPNAVDVALFRPPDDLTREPGPWRLLFVGAMTPIKGLEQLLRALAKVQRQRTDWRLDIVGEGPLRSSYESLADHLSLSPQLVFHGTKMKSEVAALMRRADLFVLASLRETFSVVCIEALASGIPVLATRCGGPEDFINEAVGRLVPPGDIDGMAGAISEMLDDLARFAPLQLAEYAATRFSHERIGRQLDSIYREA